MDTVLVTGGSGFIGGRIARGFARQRGPESVRCLVRTHEQGRPLLDQGYQVVIGDLTDPALPQKLVAECGIVVHAAAFMNPGSRGEIFGVNVEATDRLAHAAATAEVKRFVFISSIEAYGDFGNRILTEDQPYRPVNHLYAQSKVLGEQAISRRFQQAGRDSYVHLRPGMVYGPHSRYWTHRYLDQALTGRIRVIGNRGKTYPVHEDDIVHAVTTAAERAQASGQIFNLVHDENLTWWDWAQAHHTLTGANRPQRQNLLKLRVADQINRAIGRPHNQALRSELRTAEIPHDKARRLLGWSPRHFRDGILTCKPLVLHARQQDLSAVDGSVR
jgi:nucleoside-diphosphate-sugar epimerase